MCRGLWAKVGDWSFSACHVRHTVGKYPSFSACHVRHTVGKYLSFSACHVRHTVGKYPPKRRLVETDESHTGFHVPIEVFIGKGPQ
jgi:hypothetical protein